MITTIGVMIVTSLSVAREREQGTLDQLLVSPLTTIGIAPRRRENRLESCNAPTR
ncbi:hypothetical protein EC970007_5211, partial [Escherichia coli 97.0007]